jgi:hypothetical protein
MTKRLITAAYNGWKEPEMPKSMALRNESLQRFFNEPICEHAICTRRGMLIQNTSHVRDRESGLNTMQSELNELLGHQADHLLQTIRTEKSRYARDQFQLIQALCKKYSVNSVLEAIRFCDENRLYSANYVKDYVEHRSKPQPKPTLLPKKDRWMFM